MLKKTLPPLVIFFTLLFPFKGLSHDYAKPPPISSGDTAPSQYPQAWQRLLLKLSSTYYTVVRENQVDLNASLLYTSRSLGLSRLVIIGEGIQDPELLARSNWVDSRDAGKGIATLSQTTGKNHLELLVLLGGYYAFQPFVYPKYKDSARLFLNMAIAESKKLREDRLGREALCLLGKVAVQESGQTFGDVLFNQLLNQCQRAGDLEMEAKALSYRGLYTVFSPASTPNRINDLQNAVVIYTKLGNTEEVINNLTNIGYLKVAMFQLKAAETIFSKALQLEEVIHFPFTHYSSENIAMVTTFEGEFGEPLKYALETVATAEHSRDSIGWAYFYSRLGWLYYVEGGRDQESLKWGLKAMDRFLIAGDPGLYTNLTVVIGVMCEQGHNSQALEVLKKAFNKAPPKSSTDALFYNLALSMCYTNLKQFKLAEQYIVKADLLEQQSALAVGPMRRASINYQFGNIYFDEGQYGKAKIYFERYLADPSNAISGLQRKLYTYKNLIAIDSAVHDYVSGMAHYRQYVQLLDSNFRISKLRQAEELDVKYSTAEKETRITLLNQKATLEQNSLRRANMIRDITIGGIIAVSIIVGLLFRQNRLKQKNNDVITQKNELLQRLVKEKEWLLKEVHHRVKNNLHTVICLLESQAAYLENDALKAIENSQHRIYAMSLIHQKLYQSDNVKAIDMAVYIPELIQYLEDSFGTSDQIHFYLDIEQINLNITHAIPLGLIINEAVTNSIKYAFPTGWEGEIVISLKGDGNLIKLELADNGIGIPEMEQEENEPESLGIELMKGLSSDIDATISFKINNGTVIVIEFNRDTLIDQDGLFNRLAEKERYA